jgi:hypothetical protein
MLDYRVPREWRRSRHWTLNDKTKMWVFHPRVVQQYWWQSMYLILPSRNDVKRDKFENSEGIEPDRKFSPKVNQRTIMSAWSFVLVFRSSKEALWQLVAYLRRSSWTICVRFPKWAGIAEFKLFRPIYQMKRVRSVLDKAHQRKHRTVISESTHEMVSTVIVKRGRTKGKYFEVT